MALLTIKAIVRLVIAFVIIFFVIMPPGNKLYASFKTDYVKSFDDFVDEVIETRLGSETYAFKLKEGSSIIGFSEVDSGYENILYHSRTFESGEITASSKFEKPSVSACTGKACICLCPENLEFEERILTCEFGLHCRSLEDVDIISSHPILVSPYAQFNSGNYRSWINGFLFGRSLDLSISNSLPNNELELTTLRVEKNVVGNQPVIGFCSSSMFGDINSFKNYRQEFYGNKCIITEYDEAKQFEKLAENPGTLDIDTMKKNAINKYKKFAEKYKAGRKVEESLFLIGKINFDLEQNEESLEALGNLLEKFPDTRFKEDSIGLLTQLREKGVEVPESLLE